MSWSTPSKAVIQCDEKGNEIELFENTKLAGIKLNIRCHYNIHRACTGDAKTCAGYKWKYAPDHIEGEIWGNHSCGYKVSNMGRIQYKTRKITTGYHTPSGYLKTSLGGKVYTVHRLVLETFKPNSNSDLSVDHIDRNKLNNKLDNLRWATREQQVLNRTKRRRFTHCPTCTCNTPK